AQDGRAGAEGAVTARGPTDRGAQVAVLRVEGRGAEYDRLPDEQRRLVGGRDDGDHRRRVERPDDDGRLGAPEEAARVVRHSGDRVRAGAEAGRGEARAGADRSVDVG